MFNFNKTMFKKIIQFIFLCRIEEEEVSAYKTFDQNKDGIVSQDEQDVSSNKNNVKKLMCNNKLK